MRERRHLAAVSIATALLLAPLGAAVLPPSSASLGLADLAGHGPDDPPATSAEAETAGAASDSGLPSNGTEPRHDLRVDAILADPSAPAADEPVRVFARVANGGDAASPPFGLTILLDGDTVADYYLASVPPNGTRDVDSVARRLSEGRHTVEVRITVEGDANATDNAGSAAFDVGPTRHVVVARFEADFGLGGEDVRFDAVTLAARHTDALLRAVCPDAAAELHLAGGEVPNSWEAACARGTVGADLSADLREGTYLLTAAAAGTGRVLLEIRAVPLVDEAPRVVLFRHAIDLFDRGEAAVLASFSVDEGRDDVRIRISCPTATAHAGYAGSGWASGATKACHEEAWTGFRSTALAPGSYSFEMSAAGEGRVVFEVDARA